MLAMKAAINVKPTCGHAHGCCSAGELEPSASQEIQLVPVVEYGYLRE